MKYIKQEKFPPLTNSHDVLNQKTVAVIGIGGLGSHSAEYMCRMGVGTLVLIDGDFVEESNLSRQGLYTQLDSDEVRYKVEAAKERLNEINPDVDIVIHRKRLTKDNVTELLESVDLVLDGADNMMTRYVVNEYCFQNNTPWIYAAATASTGVVHNFIPGETPCLQCIYGEPKEGEGSCDINGIILPALTLITSIQTTEALKILLDHEPSREEMRFNVWTREESSISYQGLVDESCTACQTKANKKEEEHIDRLFMICSGDSIQVNTDYTLSELDNQMSGWGFRYVGSKKEVLLERFKEEQDITEWRTAKRPRIVAFSNGKMVFHNIDKQQIKKWLSRSQTKEHAI